MAVRQMLFPLLILLATRPRIILSVHRCFSNTCSSPGVCISVCEPDEHHCHSRFSPNQIHQFVATAMGCGNTSQSADQSAAAFIPDLHVSCEGDLCNIVTGLTDEIQPVLEIPLSLPKDPPPPYREGFQVCEYYHCSPAGNCSLGYEYCSLTSAAMGYCRAVYIVNTTTVKVELFSKGCQTHGNSLDITSECHIDNQLDSPAGAVLECTCNGTLCNQNITFTHPTRHAKYGFGACQQFNCSHDCRIVQNKPVCQCPKGFHTGADKRTCEDIDECSVNNGGCDIFCINTPGSYYCNCTSDRYLSSDGKTCKVKEGLVCNTQRCTLGQCGPQRDQYCFDNIIKEVQGDTTYCAAAYVYDHAKKSWIPQWRQCFFRRTAIPLVNESHCVLESVDTHPSGDFFLCFCRSDYCNSDNKIDFPFESPFDRKATSSNPQPTSTTDLTTYRPSGMDTSQSSSTILISTAASAATPIVVRPETVGSISLPELITIVVACLSCSLVFLVLSGLCCLFLVRRTSKSSAKRRKNAQIHEDVEKKNSAVPDTLNSARSSQQILLLDDGQTKKCETSDAIELTDLSFKIPEN